MIENGARFRWQPGNRVTRQLCLDDGTWHAEGDRCLIDSPIMHGTVIAVEDADDLLVAVVEWDEGTPLRSRRHRYYEHGIDPEGGTKP